MVMRSLTTLVTLAVLLFAGEAVDAQHDHARAPSRDENALTTPQALQEDHELLHQDLAQAIDAGGQTATAAKQLRDVLHPHFVAEEAFAMPPLGLLEALVSGKMDEHAAHQAIQMTHKLREEYPKMLQEHQAIVAAAQALQRAAHDEGKPAQVQFAQRLIAHAHVEEQVLYPTSLLIGKHLELLLSQNSTTGHSSHQH